MDNDKKMSSAYMRQVNGNGRGMYLNDCLNEQYYYIELDIKDPNGKMVCTVGMSYEQFVRILTGNGETPVTLLKYRDIDGKYISEEVEKPDSVDDSMLKDMADSVGGVQNRIKDLRKDLYEALNSGKALGKKQIEGLLSQIKIIESHYEDNIPYVTKLASDKIGKLQDNAKTQLSIALNRLTGGDFKASDFNNMISGQSMLALPAPDAMPVEDEYELKERIEKSIDNMTNMELADAIHKKLNTLERFENKYYNKKEGEGYKQLFSAGACEARGGVNIWYVSYQGRSYVPTDRARLYLKFLNSLKNFKEFKTEHWFDKE
jgi:hypothetical protein